MLFLRRRDLGGHLTCAAILKSSSTAPGTPMCDRQQQLNLWRAGYAAGARQQAALDQQALLDSGRAYQAFMLQQLIGQLAELLAGEYNGRHPAPNRRAA
jgi:hypothetical protein